MQTDTDAPDTISKLFKAIEAGDLDTVRDLVEADPQLATARNKDGASALTWATYQREKPICDFLLAQGIKPDIFEASALGMMDRAEELVKRDRHVVDRYSFDGWTPLHLAAHFGHTDVLRMLIANGADHRAISKNSNSNQPLQAAAAGRQRAAVELLLKAGADVDARSHGGFTALHIAAENGDRVLVDAMLRAGADVRATTDGGKTALDFAIEADRGEVVEVLEKAAEKPSKPKKSR